MARRAPEGFDSRPYTRFSLAPVTPTIGAEISGLRLGGNLPDETIADLRRALLEWKVLIFRDQAIDRAAHRDFALRWGALEQHPFFQYTQPGQSAVAVATLAKDAQTSAAENIWHNDMTWHTTPSFAVVLRAVEIPPVGGDTLGADMGAAYDLLPDDLKAPIDPLLAEHDWMQSAGRAMPQDAIELLRAGRPTRRRPGTTAVASTTPPATTTRRGA